MRGSVQSTWFRALSCHSQWIIALVKRLQEYSLIDMDTLWWKIPDFKFSNVQNRTVLTGWLSQLLKTWSNLVRSGHKMGWANVAGCGLDFYARVSLREPSCSMWSEIPTLSHTLASREHFEGKTTHHCFPGFKVPSKREEIVGLTSLRPIPGGKVTAGSKSHILQMLAFQSNVLSIPAPMILPWRDFLLLLFSHSNRCPDDTATTPCLWGWRTRLTTATMGVNPL